MQKKGKKKTLKARERQIDTSIHPRVSGLTALMLTSITPGHCVVESCFGLLSSHKHGINDNPLKIRFKPNVLKYSVCVIFFIVVVEGTRYQSFCVFENRSGIIKVMSYFIPKHYSSHFFSQSSSKKLHSPFCVFVSSAPPVASFAAVFRLVPPHKRLLNRAIYSFPIVLPIRQSNQSRSRKESF